jgi:hypothetical protein
MSEDNIQGKIKKPIYKKWWFWVIIAIILYALVNSAAKDPKDEASNENEGATVTQAADDTQDNTNTEETEVTEDAVDTSDEDELDANKATDISEDAALTRDNSTAELTVLNTGKFVVGTDISVGRYVITGDGSGNLFINNEEGESYVNEILSGGDLGVKSVTTDIIDGDTIEISGISNATFTPAETVLYTDTLSTGTWIIGLDFPPGRYDISSSDGNGNLFIYDKSGWAEVNEILGGGNFGIEKVTADLKEGYKIIISGMNEVKFVEK